MHHDGASAWWALAPFLLAALILVPGLRADGDPPSDYLLVQNVYVPNQVPSPAVATALRLAVGEVYAAGDRLKVALVYDATDLGSIPSLYGKPAEYAHFLGVELGLWYVGPLLVVMPAGFGVYDGGRSTEAEEQALRGLSISATSPDELARSATTAVQRLRAVRALLSPDVKAPLVTAHPAFARRGRTAILHFDVFDDSGRSKASVQVYEDDSPVARLTSPPQFKIGTRNASVRWLVPVKLRSRRLRFCVIASDPAGNRSKAACALFLRVS
jgi:hypothetical protein